MGPLGLPLSTCAAVIVGCLATGASDQAVDLATIKSIDSYCAASWQRANIPRQEWEDCSQQAFARLLSRVSQDRWVEAINDLKSRHRRELNKCIWATTQWWRRSHRHRSLDKDDLPDRTHGPDFGITVPEILKEMNCDGAGLTPIQRSLVNLWASGYSVPEMSAKLDIPRRRVSDEKYRALAKLRAKFGGC